MVKLEVKRNAIGTRERERENFVKGLHIVPWLFQTFKIRGRQQEDVQRDEKVVEIEIGGGGAGERNREGVIEEEKCNEEK